MAAGGEPDTAVDRGTGQRGARYLDAVAARLRMPLSAEQDVLDELRAHLDDAVEALEAEGLDPADAEREALARLGSPAELGDDLRRAHQTRRRLFAAVGGGMWEGLKDGIAGYILGGIVGSIVVLSVISALEKLLPTLGAPRVYDRALQTIITGVGLSIATWWAARGMVRATARRSFRRVEHVRLPIALVGGVVLVGLLVVWRLWYSWPAVAAMGLIPVSFVVAARTARDPDAARRGRWSVGRPSGVQLLAIVVGLWVAGAITISALPGAPDAGCCDASPASGGDAWTAAGFGVVAQTAVAVDRSPWRTDFEPDAMGNVAVTLDDDELDWDDWTDLRVEAWPAVATINSDESRLESAAAAPYAVVAIEPWSRPGAIVPVGSTPGVSGYLLFVTGRDRDTGARVAIGPPEGHRVAFSGTIVDWFARLGS